MASSEAHCKQHSGCAFDGHCGFADGRCAATNNGSCEASHQCKQSGACVAKDGACVVAKDEHCAASLLCKHFGLCSAKDGACVVAGDADCKKSSPCKTAGRCKARGGACWVPGDSDAACRKFAGSEGATPCFAEGECKAKEGVRVAASNKRCGVSRACVHYWRCHLVGDRCAKSMGCEDTERDRCVYREDIDSDRLSGAQSFMKGRVVRSGKCGIPTTQKCRQSKSIPPKVDPLYRYDSADH